MAAERASGSKFAQAVSNHILGDVDRHVAAAIMHGDGMPYHLGKDHARATPGSENLLFAFRVHLFNFFASIWAQ